MPGRCCDAAARHFDATVADKDVAQYRARGLDKRARLLADALCRSGVGGRSVLDVGSGVGAVSFELLKAGAAHATLADASPAYLTAASAEAARTGVSDRVDLVQGDFVDTANGIPAADIVVMDRVICCYPDWAPLLDAAANRARALLGLVYPRARPDVRLVIGIDNLRRRLKGDPFRAFVHRPADMEAALRDLGWRLGSRAGTFVWRVDVFSRG